jgi:WD40 repeat protein
MVTAESAVVPAVPYRGIRAFRFVDQPIFFGRAEETERLARLVSVYRGVMLYGGTGSGKSSLVNAGLLPRLMALGMQPERVRVQPRQGEELVIGRIATDEDGSAWLPSSLAGDDAASRVVLSVEELERRVGEADHGRPTLLIFDQFEELCTLFETREARIAQERIVGLVERLMRQPMHVKLLFVFRDDYLARIKDLLGAAPELVDQALHLTPLGAGALPTIIRRPFESHPGHYEREIGADLAERLRSAFAERFGSAEVSLSEVQTVCLRLWVAADPDRMFADKNVQGVLEDSLGEAFDAFPDDLRYAAVAVLGQMVTAAGTRNVVSVSDLVQRVCDDDRTLPRDLVEHALERLEHGSRLVRREHRRDVDLYEITSEFLVPWISERRAEALRVRERRRDRRRFLALSAVAAALALFAALVAALAAWALHQRGEARQAASSATGMALTGASVVHRYDRLDVPLLLALGGYQAASGFQEQNALVTALQRMVGFDAVLHGHDGAATDVDFDSRDGVVASAGTDDTIRLWSVAAHRQLGAPLRAQSGGVNAIAFSPNHRLLVSAGVSGRLRLWDVAARRPVGRPLRSRGRGITGVAFSPDGRILASVAFDRRIRLWSVARRQQLLSLSVPGSGANSIAFSPDGRTLASGGFDGSIRLWSAATHRQLGAPLRGHRFVVTSLAFSPDGTRLASGGQDHTARLWSVATHRQLGRPIRFSQSVRDVAFAPDGRTLASAVWDSTITFSNVETHAMVGKPVSLMTGAPEGVAFSADGGTLAVADWDGTVRLIPVHGPRELGVPLTRSSGGAGSSNVLMSDVAFSPDGRLLATGSWDDTVRLWDVARRRQLGRPLPGNPSSVASVAFSPDGRLLAAAGYDKAIRLWSVATRRRVGVLRGHREAVVSVAFSPDSRLLVSGGWDNSVRLWDVRRRRQSGPTMRGHRQEVESVAFSPNGRLVASGGDDARIRLWSVATHRQVGILRGHTGSVESIAFSPDGRMLASGSQDDTVRFWDVARRAQVGSELADHKADVVDVAFSSRGDLLASVGADGSLRLWDVAHRTALGAPQYGGGALAAVAFGPVGERIATAGDDGTVRMWSGFLWDGLGEVQRRACRLAGQDLSRGEWARYVPGVTYRKVCDGA